MRRMEALYFGHLSLDTRHSSNELPDLSRSGWKLISIPPRSWSVSFTFLAGFRGRQIWSLKGITDAGWGIVTSQFCFSSPLPLFSAWNCSVTISSITCAWRSGEVSCIHCTVSPRQHDLLNLPRCSRVLWAWLVFTAVKRNPPARLPKPWDLLLLVRNSRIPPLQPFERVRLFTWTHVHLNVLLECVAEYSATAALAGPRHTVTASFKPPC